VTKKTVVDIDTGQERSSSERLLTFCQNLNWENLPLDVRQSVKRHLLDTFGVIVAGMQKDVAQKVATTLSHNENVGIKAPGSDLPLSRRDCAFICGVAAHGLELDDGYRQGSVHPGVAVIPALYSWSAGKGLPGKRILEGVVVGYETIARIARACNPRALRERGFHPTSVVGPLGAALAVGKVMGLSDKLMSNALGISASSSSGLFAFLSGGGDVKRLHAGQAALGGYNAAVSAAANISGPANILETKSGFFQSFVSNYSKDPLGPFPPQTQWQILDCYIKPHACCRHIQPAFEALCTILNEQELSEEDVQSIRVETYNIAAAHADTGWNDFISAQLSFPYLLALALLYGSADLELFEKNVRDKISDSQITRKFSICETEEMDKLYPEKRPARVIVKTKHSEYEMTSYHALGGRDRPMSDDQLSEKFTKLVEPVYGKNSCASLLESFWYFDELDNADILFDHT